MASRRIKAAKAKFISLVQRGANRVPIIYKSEGESAEFDCIVKADADKGEVLSIVYAPEFRDSHGDIASAEVIKSMAYESMKDGISLDLFHDGKKLTPDQAYLAESFIVQKGDARFADLKGYRGETFDPTGSWATLIKVEDPTIRADIKSGKLNGVSIMGPAVLELNKSGSGKGRAAKLISMLADHLGMSPQRRSAYQSVTLSGDIQMTPDELKKELDTRDTNLLAGIGKLIKSEVGSIQDAAIAKAAGVEDSDSAEVRSAKITLHKAGKGPAAAETPGSTPAAPAVPAVVEPVFKGDLSKAEDVAQFDYDVQVFQIRKAMDPKKPESVKDAATKIAALTKPGAATDDLAKSAGVKASDTDEVKGLKVQLHKAEQRSNQQQPTQGKDTSTQTIVTGLTKDEQDGLSIGKRMGEYANKQRATPDGFKLVG